ncbi:MAG: hypothetical protein ACE5HS_10115 [bacterium]
MERSIKIIAILHGTTAVGIVIFWIGFYNGVLFPVAFMRSKIAHFDGYYAWETAFTIPDMLLASAMMFASVRLLKNQNDQTAVYILLSASGALIFLGLLDFVYDLGNGMYRLHHFYSYLLLLIGVCLPILGLVSIFVLNKHSRQLNLKKEPKAWQN